MRIGSLNMQMMRKPLECVNKFKFDNDNTKRKLSAYAWATVLGNGEWDREKWKEWGEFHFSNYVRHVNPIRLHTRNWRPLHNPIEKVVTFCFNSILALPFPFSLWPLVTRHSGNVQPVLTVRTAEWPDWYPCPMLPSPGEGLLSTLWRSFGFRVMLIEQFSICCTVFWLTLSRGCDMDRDRDSKLDSWSRYRLWDSWLSCLSIFQENALLQTIWSVNFGACWSKDAPRECVLCVCAREG